MNTPHLELMQRYGTDRLFQEKTAGAAPLLARLGMALLNYKLTESGLAADERQREEDELRMAARLELERAQMAQATQSLRHTPVPLDEGMMRLASIAAETGADQAKEAGIGGAAASLAPVAGDLFARGKKLLGGGLGWKGNLAVGGAALGAGVLATKGIQGAARAAGREPEGPAVFGMGSPGRTVGYQIPFGTNQYGVPQVGTPL